MGRPIVYCADCGTSLHEIEFDQGRAHTFENRPYCSTCRTPPPAEPALPTATPRRAVSSARTARVPLADPPLRVPPAVWLGGGAAALLLLVVAVAVLSAPSGPPPPPPDPAPAPKPVARTDPAPSRPDPAKLDGFLSEIRKILAGGELAARKGEVESMLKSALEVADGRRREVEDLGAEFGRRLLQAELRAALVGHWPFDQTLGATAADASGKNQAGRLEKGPQWVDGQVGGGLRFDGVDDYVELSNAPTLDKLQVGSYSVSAWFRPERDPPGKDRAPNAGYGIVMKEGYNEGLCYLAGGRFNMKHWIAGNKETGVVSDASAPPGRFYHVAGSVSRDGGQTRLYVDGKLEKTATYPAKTAGREFAAAKWRIGIAKASTKAEYAWPAHGVIDDVRFFNRALTEAEAKFLFDEGAAGRSP